MTDTRVKPPEIIAAEKLLRGKRSDDLGIINMVVRLIGETVVPMLRDDMIAPLVKRIAELETRQLKHVGTWAADKQYLPGNCVSHGGSVWTTDIESKGVRPGDANAIWRLIVKRGRDGKDAGGR
jgi:hypothetical protein